MSLDLVTIFGYDEKRELSYTVGMQIDRATMENSMEISLKTRNKTTI